MESKDLRRAGLKVTLPRLKILEILERGAHRHMSAEDVYRELMEAVSYTHLTLPTILLV